MYCAAGDDVAGMKIAKDAKATRGSQGDEGTKRTEGVMMEHDGPETAAGVGR